MVRPLYPRLPSAQLMLALLAAVCMSSASAVSCGGAGGAPPPRSAPSPLLNAELLPLAGRTTDGMRIAPEQIQGRVVVLKFFAKYCAPCERTLPEAERIHREQPEVLVIGVSDDESRADLDYLIQKHGLSFPIVHDRSKLIRGRFRVAELPATFIANKAGKVVWVGGETHTHGDLLAVIQSLQ